jgi:hypothetical protein
VVSKGTGLEEYVKQWVRIFGFRRGSNSDLTALEVEGIQYPCRIFTVG